MSSRNPFDFDREGNWVNNPVTIVDRLIGSAYDVVKLVACNMQYIRHVSHHMESIFNIARNPMATVVVPVTITATGAKVVELPVKQESIRGLYVMLKTPTGSVMTINSNLISLGAVGTNLTILIDGALPVELLGSIAYVSIVYDWKIQGDTNV